MVSRSIFHLFLTVAVIVILIGILSIIFIQFDRGYLALDSENEIERQQNQLIQQMYQGNQGNASIKLTSEHQSQATADVINLIEQVKLDDLKSADRQVTPSETDQDIARINRANQLNYTETANVSDSQYPYYRQMDYQQYWLSHNPWSPDYSPGRR